MTVLTAPQIHSLLLQEGSYLQEECVKILQDSPHLAWADFTPLNSKWFLGLWHINTEFLVSVCKCTNLGGGSSSFNHSEFQLIVYQAEGQRGKQQQDMDFVHCLPVHCFRFSSKRNFILEFEGKRQDISASSLDECFGGELNFFLGSQQRVQETCSHCWKLRIAKVLHLLLLFASRKHYHTGDNGIMWLPVCFWAQNWSAGL